MTLFILMIACTASKDSAEGCTLATGEVRICAVDATGQPLLGGQAYAQQEGQDLITTYTEDDGCVSLALPVGDWEVGLYDGCTYKAADVRLEACDRVDVEAQIDVPCVGS